MHERTLMAVPDGVDWAGGGRPARGLHDRPRRALHASAACGPASGCSSTARAGGVGTAAVQLGVAAGARVHATVRNEAAPRRASPRSARPCIAPDDFVDHGPFDVILELVGAPNLADNLQALATGGRISMIGIGAGRDDRDRPARC